MIVDSQVHVWPAPSPTGPSAPRPPHRVALHTADRLIDEMRASGIDRAVLFSPPWDPDAREARAAVARDPSRFRRVARLPVRDPASGPEMLRRWADDPTTLAARVVLVGENAALLAGGTLDWLWATAQDVGLAVMCFAPGELRQLDRIAVRYPDLRLVVDHLGMSAEIRGKPLQPAVDELVVLARHPLVAVKASALPDFVEEPYPFPSLHGPIRQVIDAFGIGRVFWGSDVSRLPCSYPEAVDLFRNAMALSPSERASILGDGVVEWLGWTEPAPPRPETVGYSEVHQS